MNNHLSRREFSAGLVSAGLLAATRRSALGANGANGRVRLGIVGTGNRGDQLIDAILAQPDAQITALCDVYEPYLEFARQKVGGQPFLTEDYRRLLERKDVDAVVIATPDHWHALQFIDACKAGKDVYVEKPLSLTIGEGRKMIEAARRAQCITQMGAHRRSQPLVARCRELVQSGAIGQVTSCRCFHLTNEFPMGIGNPPDSDPPAGLNWDLWLGPARKVPYNENRCLYKFRWFYEYSGGQLTNFGTHWLDMIQNVTGQDAPCEVFATGTRGFINDNREIPETMEAVWKYPSGMMVNFSQFNTNDTPGNDHRAWVEFRGTEGTLHYMNGSIEIVPQKVRDEPLPAQNPTQRKECSRQQRAVTASKAQPLKETGPLSNNDHIRNFLDGVKERKTCTCPVETGHLSTVPTLLARIAHLRGRRLEWDAKKERFTNDDEANRMLYYAYQAPWKLD